MDRCPRNTTSPFSCTKINDVRAEADRAHKKYGPFKSSHEGFGVLAEEIDELLTAIRHGSIDDIQEEAIQVSAVALRIAECCDDQPFVRRSL